MGGGGLDNELVLAVVWCGEVGFHQVTTVWIGGVWSSMHWHVVHGGEEIRARVSEVDDGIALADFYRVREAVKGRRWQQWWVPSMRWFWNGKGGAATLIRWERGGPGDA
jgi:hypothetical protein